MSKIGFYRYKVGNATSQTVTLYVNGSVSKTKQVVVKAVCTGYRQLKFIDRNGQYRFYPFAAEYGIKDKPKEIGQANEFITSLLTNRSDTKSIGSDNTRSMTLRASNVSESELAILADIYTSPRVYLYVGSGSTDTVNDWVLVSVFSVSPNSSLSAMISKYYKFICIAIGKHIRITINSIVDIQRCID